MAQMAEICGIEIGNTKMKIRKTLINILMTIIGIGLSHQESKDLNIKVQMAFITKYLKKSVLFVEANIWLISMIKVNVQIVVGIMAKYTVNSLTMLYFQT